jgi:DNA polymerase I
MSKKSSNKKIVILDAHAIIHRAYHALPDFSSSRGEPTGALYGISTMLFAIIKEFKPDYIVAAFDLPKPTYRHEAYADYKSGRKAIDDNLIKQLQRSRDVFKAFNIPIYEKEGFEADDVIGTVAKQLDKKDVDVIIASGDMDTMQLVKGKKVQVYTLKKGIKDTILYDEKAVKERFKFGPKLLIDYKGLRGDASDNIIGIPGIGEKTATDLITKVGTIEQIYKKIDKLEGLGFKPRIVGLLKEHKEEAEFSKMLATIRLDVPIKTDLKKLDWNKNVSVKKIKALFDELEFRSLNNRLQEIFNGLGHEVIEPEEKKEEDLDDDEVKEAVVALWVLNSSITNPNVQDVLSFAKTDDFVKAKKYIFDELKKQGTSNQTSGEDGTGQAFKVYETIEKPLIKIVDEMGENGVKIDTKVLDELSKDYHKKLSKLETEIYKMSGEEFNINSPKQMADVLFVKMELKYKGMRKTPSGSFSTKEEVLQKLVEVHPIAEKVLEYRELQKLLSTYIDNFPKHVGKDGRIHPRFIQAGAATGRMASEDPAVQNIPIRSQLGRKIRDAFVAPRGKKLLAFDYSQIELRIAAILSGDEKLLKTFKEGKDIHTSVAMYVFDVKEEDVTKDMRSKAKTINFGILYGMGVTALQKNLKTDRKEAQDFYNNYFETFSTLASYLEETKKFAAQNGYTETLFGRRRYFEGIKSKLPFIRAAAERMAINAPVQGTSADVLKLAMIGIDEYLEKEKLKDKVKLILQVHDEVIFECDKDLVDQVARKVKEIMESAFGDKDTKGVPIVVEGSSGTNWGGMMRLML